MQDDSMPKNNPALETAREVLKSYFTTGVDITPELSTRSMNDEIIRDDSCFSAIMRMNELEDAMQFETVCNQFVVIESNTVPAVVDDDLANMIARGKGDWQLLQKKSVSIRREKAQTWNLKEIAKGVFQWMLRYDSFLGYMRGVLDIERSKKDTMIV